MPLATLRQRFASNLDTFRRESVEDPARAAAAVAVVLTVEPDGNPAFLLTRRSQKLRKHPGQYALPGGRIDPGENVVGAALRELDEELGLSRDPGSVLGMLDDFPTRSGFVITPVVVWAGVADDLAPNPEEVDLVHRVPLSELEREDLLVLDEVPGSEHPVLSLRLVDNRVFAPTGAILYQLLEVVLRGNETRVGHYEQPRFAWR